MNKRRFIAVLLLLLVGLAGWGYARVFRAVEVPGGRLNTAGFSWEPAYRTRMVVNGRREAVYVYSARFGEPVGEQFKEQYEAQGAQVTLSETPDMTLASARWKEGEARLLVLSPESQPNQIVFIFYPEPGAVEDPQAFPVAHYPRGRVLNTAGNLANGTRCAALETTDSIDRVHAFYAGVLSADGWKPALPEWQAGMAGGHLAMYFRNNDVCCVLVKNGGRRPNRVTVLVKGGGL